MTLVKYIIVFYDVNGDVVDSYASMFSESEGEIPAGLGKRISKNVKESVKRLTAKVEIRILNFEIVHEVP